VDSTGALVTMEDIAPPSSSISQVRRTEELEEAAAAASREVATLTHSQAQLDALRGGLKQREAYVVQVRISLCAPSDL
jgi:hypothetical protein